MLLLQDKSFSRVLPEYGLLHRCCLFWGRIWMEHSFREIPRPTTVGWRRKESVARFSVLQQKYEPLGKASFSIVLTTISDLPSWCDTYDTVNRCKPTYLVFWPCRAGLHIGLIITTYFPYSSLPIASRPASPHIHPKSSSLVSYYFHVLGSRPYSTG